MGSFAGLGRGVVLRNLHDGCTEWRLQIMTEVGNAIMENGGLGREGGGTREFEKLLEDANGRLRKKDQEGCFEEDIF
jgi:hypothetical protein